MATKAAEGLGSLLSNQGRSKPATARQGNTGGGALWMRPKDGGRRSRAGTNGKFAFRSRRDEQDEE